jgi:segregation and condensation protein A
MDIFDLDVARITDEYLAFIEREGVHSLADAYHFLAMAATLVELKSRLLLPQPPRAEAAEDEAVEEPLDPRLALAHKLAAYEEIQKTTEDLAQRYEQTGRHWPRQIVQQLEAEIVYAMDSLSVYDLMTAFAEVLERPRFKQITIFQEDYDVEEARRRLRSRLSGGPATLKALLLEHGNVFALIVTFIAVLDLIKEDEISFERTEQSVNLALTGKTPGVQG